MINQTKVIFFLLAGLFAILFLVFLYYLYAEKFNTDAVMDYDMTSPDPLSPEASSNVTDATTSAPLTSTKSEISEPGVFNEKSGPVSKQVYNIGENKYTYKEAQALCKAFGSDIASLEQLMGAYRGGADWCNYGWVDGQMAFYPTQKKTWLKLQKNDTKEKRTACGQPGINGGYFDNENLRFGVTCYGIKPEPRAHEKIKQPLISDADAELQKMVNKFKEEIDDMTILPFNRDKWGAC